MCSFVTSCHVYSTRAIPQTSGRHVRMRGCCTSASAFLYSSRRGPPCPGNHQGCSSNPPTMFSNSSLESPPLSQPAILHTWKKTPQRRNTTNHRPPPLTGRLLQTRHRARSSDCESEPISFHLPGHQFPLSCCTAFSKLYLDLLHLPPQLTLRSEITRHQHHHLSLRLRLHRRCPQRLYLAIHRPRPSSSLGSHS